VALLKLHREGILSLPEPGVRHWAVVQAQRSPLSLPEVESLCCRLKTLGEIKLVLVGNSNRLLSRLWNDLMETHHYLGAGPLCGAQVRYLIESSVYGWLGGLAFSAAAWRVAPRDRWIGWSEEARKANLGKVVCNRATDCPFGLACAFALCRTSAAGLGGALWGEAGVV
jgi:hypothetical protein